MLKVIFLNLLEEKKNFIIEILIKYFVIKFYYFVDILDVVKECRVVKGSMY